MRLLLDTHLLLWAAKSAERVPLQAAEMIANRGNTLHFSAVSVWEVAIKFSRGRPDFQTDPHQLRAGLLDAGYREIAITGEHAQHVSTLPALHGDPFDRLLLAQAWVEGLLLLTSDAELAAYPGPIQRV